MSNGEAESLAAWRRLRLPPIRACSKAVRGCWILKLPIRPGPNLPMLCLQLLPAQRTVGLHGAVSSSPTIPPSTSAVHEFAFRYPLLIPHNLFDLLIL